MLVCHSCQHVRCWDVRYCGLVTCHCHCHRSASPHSPQVSLSLDSSPMSVSRERLIYISKLNWSHNHFLSCGKIGFDECLNLMYSVFRLKFSSECQVRWASDTRAAINCSEQEMKFISITAMANPVWLKQILWIPAIIVRCCWHKYLIASQLLSRWAVLWSSALPPPATWRMSRSGQINNGRYLVTICILISDTAPRSKQASLLSYATPSSIALLNTLFALTPLAFMVKSIPWGRNLLTTVELTLLFSSKRDSVKVFGGVQVNTLVVCLPSSVTSLTLIKVRIEDIYVFVKWIQGQVSFLKMWN